MAPRARQYNRGAKREIVGRSSIEVSSAKNLGSSHKSEDTELIDKTVEISWHENQEKL